MLGIEKTEYTGGSKLWQIDRNGRQFYINKNRTPRIKAYGFTVNYDKEPNLPAVLRILLLVGETRYSFETWRTRRSK